MADGRKPSIGSGSGRSRRASGLQTPPARTPRARPADAVSLGQQFATVAGSDGRRGEFRQSREAAAPASTTTTGGGPASRESPIDTGSPGLAEKMLAMEILSTASRPGYGSLGRKYRLNVNHFEMRVKLLTHCHYHVEIAHDMVNFRLTRDDNRPILWQCLLRNSQQLGLNREDLYKLAYDGVSNLYSLNPLTLPRENMEFQVFLPLRPDRLHDPWIRQRPPAVDLLGGREIWRGLFTSVQVGQNNKIFINMDTSHTSFYKQNVNGERYTCIMFLCDVLNMADRTSSNAFRPDQLNERTSLNDAMVQVFHREIKGLKVCKSYSDYQSRQHNVLGVDKSPLQISFSDKDGNSHTVADYFAQIVGPLRFPMMPTLKLGSAKKSIHIPVEHCYLAPRQKIKKKLTEIQTTIMIRQTCMPPMDRKLAIERMVEAARFRDDPFLRAFNVEISPRMHELDGRVLTAPPIRYMNNQTCLVRDGVWRGGNMKLLMPANLNGCAAVAFQPAGTLRDARGFIFRLLQVCQQAGMRVPDPNNVFFHLETDTSAQRVEKAFQSVSDAMKSRKFELSLIIVFLPMKGSPLYAEVKRTAEIQMGLMTQCITHKTVEKCTPDVLSNLVYKINMKLGGINCELDMRNNLTKVLFQEPTLVLGIDVTHPGPTDKRSPSVASVVGSMDKTFMRYAASIKVQKRRHESLVYLSEPMTERLMYFYKETKIKPTRIIVFRDGVSEGEFQSVMQEELRSIRGSCLKVDPAYKPKITFIIVQKRHHTRFFPKNPDEGSGRAKNVYPGTVVDTDILFDTDFNFYLCSHYGIQGTSRPARYHVLYDDNQFSADNMQYLAYFLCHCYSRCTRSVSIPAPLYFAHLACARARAHLVNLVGEEYSESSSTDQSSSIPEEQLIRGSTVTDSIRKEMYFT